MDTVMDLVLGSIALSLWVVAAAFIGIAADVKRLTMLATVESMKANKDLLEKMLRESK